MLDEEGPPRRIAITGIAGYVGREVGAQLDVDEGTDHVLGIDVAPYTPPSSKVAFVQKTIEEPFADLFVEHKIDAAIHLAFCLNPMRDRAREERINIEGTKNFLDACSKAKVKMVLVASSATAYGAHPDNAGILYEGAPLRASPDFPYAHDKVRIEELCYEFARANPDACLAIVRPCVIIGPHVSNYLSRMLEKPIIFAPWSPDPPIQFIHEDDAVRAIFRLLKHRKMGLFNLAADGAMTLGRIAEMSGRRLVRLPVFLLRWIMALAWRFGWTSVTEAPPGYLDYALYPWCVSNVKLKTELLFMFKYDALRAVSDFVESRSGEQEGTARTRMDDIVDVDDEDLDELEEVDEDLENAASPGANGDAISEADTPVVGTPRDTFGAHPDPSPPVPEPAAAPPAAGEGDTGKPAGTA
jgi:UDP-glucose 4-epimerase